MRCFARRVLQAERYDEMVKEMDKVASLSTGEGGELSVEERNLLSVAYKNVIGSRRASWRIVSSIEQKEESKGNEEHVKRIRQYRSVVRARAATEGAPCTPHRAMRAERAPRAAPGAYARPWARRHAPRRAGGGRAHADLRQHPVAA